MNELMVVRQLPVIEERLRVLAPEIEKRVTDAMSLVCGEDSLKAVKSIRAELNKEFSAFESQRKAIKEAVLTPLTSFDEVYKECVTGPFKAADANLKEKISEVEDGLRQEKREKVNAYFQEYATAIGVPFVTLEDSPVHVTLTASIKSLKEQSKRFLDQIAGDCTAIASMQYAEEILVEYQHCLQLNQAIATVNARHEQMEQQRQYLKEQTEKATPPEKPMTKAFSAPVEVPEPKPEPGLDEDDSTLYAATFTVTDTKKRLRLLAQFLRENGYEFT